MDQATAVLGPKKPAVLDAKKMLVESGVAGRHAALASAAGQAFCNTSRLTEQEEAEGLLDGLLATRER